MRLWRRAGLISPHCTGAQRRVKKSRSQSEKPSQPPHSNAERRRSRIDTDAPLPRAKRRPRRARFERGLPFDEELVRLARTYLERQRQHWPEIVQAGLAAFTGLRAQELASLTARSFDLSTEPATIRVETCYSKHRRADVLPLADDLVERLRTYLTQRAVEKRRYHDDGRLWPGRWHHKAAILRNDMEAAREAWLKEATNARTRKEREASDFLIVEDGDGQVVAFHTLQHSFITYLVTVNMPPKVAPMLARHLTITLTMDRYSTRGATLGHGKRMLVDTMFGRLQWGVDGAGSYQEPQACPPTLKREPSPERNNQTHSSHRPAVYSAAPSSPAKRQKNKRRMGSNSGQRKLRLTAN